MTNFLDDVRAKVIMRLKTKPLLPFEQRVPHRFLELFANAVTTSDAILNNFQIIPEIKFASPSVCQFPHANAVDLATAYVAAGAKAISMVTEPYFFAGDYQSLIDVRQNFPGIFILMKDFIVDEQQLVEARGLGADAILLIAAFLPVNRLKQLYQAALDLDLTPLVEVHTVTELRDVETLGSPLIGVNNRDLKSLEVKPDTALDLIGLRKTNAIYIALSGVATAHDLQQLAQHGYQGVVMGSHLLQSKHPGQTLIELRSQVHHDAC